MKNKYMILGSESLVELNKLVNNAVIAGYVLRGHVQVSFNDKSFAIYLATMELKG